MPSVRCTVGQTYDVPVAGSAARAISAASPRSTRAQLLRLPDQKRAAELDQIARCFVETFHVEPDDDPVVGCFERGFMQRDDASRLLEAGLEEGFDVPGARRDRQRVLDEG